KVQPSVQWPPSVWQSVAPRIVPPHPWQWVALPQEPYRTEGVSTTPPLSALPIPAPPARVTPGRVILFRIIPVRSGTTEQHSKRKATGNRVWLSPLVPCFSSSCYQLMNNRLSLDTVRARQSPSTHRPRVPLGCAPAPLVRVAVCASALQYASCTLRCALDWDRSPPRREPGARPAA